MRLTCAHSEFCCRRSSILVFCKKNLNEHKSAAQMWDITLAGYTSQSAIETLLIITTGSDQCSHDADEILSTWLKTAGVYMQQLLASTDTVTASATCPDVPQPGQQGSLQPLCNQVSMTDNTRCSHCNCNTQHTVVAPAVTPPQWLLLPCGQTWQQSRSPRLSTW